MRLLYCECETMNVFMYILYICIGCIKFPELRIKRLWDDDEREKIPIINFSAVGKKSRLISMGIQWSQMILSGNGIGRDGDLLHAGKNYCDALSCAISPTLFGFS